MTSLDLILLIIILLIALYFIILFIFDFIIYYLLLKKYYHSLMKVYEFGYLIAISGQIRKGKTILMHALTHALVLKIKKDLNQRMYDIESILIEINFLEIKNKFLLYLENGLSFNKAQENIIKSFEINFNEKMTYVKNLDDYYFDGLKYIKRIDMLKDYIYFFYHSLRVDHVYSNIRSFNQITSSYSKTFKSDWTKLKNNKDYEFPLDEFSVFNYDEVLLGNSNSNAIKKLNEDSGSDIFFRLFGQEFRETSYYITTLQNVKRWFKSEREIITSFLYVRNSKLVYNRPLYFKLLLFLENIVNWFYDHIHKNDDYRADENKYKRIRLNLINKQKKIIANSFIKFDISYYDDVDIVGKQIDDDKQTSNMYNTELIFPVCYCWDIGNSHEFHKLFLYFKERSKIDRTILGETELDNLVIEEILRKDIDKSDNSTAKYEVKPFDPDSF